MNRIYLLCIAVLASWSALADSDYPDNLQVKECNFQVQGQWWNQSPTQGYPPLVVANNPTTGEPEFCEFYQFSWDWMRYLVSPVSQDKFDEPRWQDQSLFPLLETRGTNSCDDSYPANALMVRSMKSMKDSSPFVLPERIDQAFADAIYDQNGNIVLYEIRFSQNLCDVTKIQSQPNFPGGTLEMKTAWRILGDDEANSGNYYVMQAVIAENSVERTQTLTLGLVGLHLAISADNHPEMVWVTLEHQDNNPLCDDLGPTVTGGPWSFTSASCAQTPSDCQFNQTVKAAGLTKTGLRTEICQGYAHASKPDDRDYSLNTQLVNKLNSYIGGEDSIFAQQGTPESLQVWKNYFVVGALWVSDVEKDSTPDNQRGSLQLANTVMETQFQRDAPWGKGTMNCFECHNYSGTKSNTSPSAFMSHIFDDIVKDIDAPPSPICPKPNYKGNVPVDGGSITMCNAVCTPGKWTGGVKGHGLFATCECCP
ncbi:hypothetical protein [Ferrimonas sp. YFM]|uniref:hypothetical protein n=1 Tax=Ferrimonas sp. YFM TaxID=3028878 RepID=UPI00257266F2|nr:hypothetical protein [Ferrimonas sp. YFM]BDY03478.1 hypothetical protein F0521_05190 [Ferrimonas sp. YFM]